MEHPNDKMWINATLDVLISSLVLLKATHMADRSQSRVETTKADLDDLLTTIFPEVIGRCKAFDRAAIAKAKEGEK